MIKNLRLRVRPEVWHDAERMEELVSRECAVSRHALKGLRIVHESIDARQRQVMIQLEVDAYIDELPPAERYETVDYHPVPPGAPQAVVVGAGPAGLFAALRLIQGGVKPVLLERGRNVTDRRRDVALITSAQAVNPNSNYCFGEGGAGAFSDGKLFTRSKKRGNVHGILQRLCQFGADTGILSASHPHLGTDRLPKIIAAIREEILRCGGEIHFETCVEDLQLTRNHFGETEVHGVVTRDGRSWDGPVILATGHSARDVYRMLHGHGILLEPKGIAMGVRLEHPQTLIDRIQYHSPQGRGTYLPAAEYSFVTQVEGRGVYSFCMCPGGVVVPSATGLEQVVVNGMSASARSGRFCNAAMVVEIRPEDIPVLAGQIDLAPELRDTPLAVMALQEAVERHTWLNGGRTQQCPAQRMEDFVAGRLSDTLPAVSYAPGAVASPLHFWLPPFLSGRLRSAFSIFGRNARGFLTNEAVLLASETRTSAPVRIPRDRDLFVHPAVAGLYPVGEGAGFAGGIVSAALDGEKCAAALLAKMGL